MRHSVKHNACHLGKNISAFIKAKKSDTLCRVRKGYIKNGVSQNTKDLIFYVLHGFKREEGKCLRLDDP